MPCVVVLRLDPAGACPLILRDDSEPLTGGAGVRYRLVAETGDHGEAMRIADALQRECADGGASRFGQSPVGAP